MAQPDPLGPITTWPYFRNVSDEEAVRLLNEVVNPTNTARYIIVNPRYMIRKYELFPDDETIFVVVVIDKFGIIHHTIIILNYYTYYYLLSHLILLYYTMTTKHCVYLHTNIYELPF